jgi:hypothetical protein
MKATLISNLLVLFKQNPVLVQLLFQEPLDQLVFQLDIGHVQELAQVSAKFNIELCEWIGEALLKVLLDADRQLLLDYFDSIGEVGYLLDVVVGVKVIDHVDDALEDECHLGVLFRLGVGREQGPFEQKKIWCQTVNFVSGNK